MAVFMLACGAPVVGRRPPARRRRRPAAGPLSRQFAAGIAMTVGARGARRRRRRPPDVPLRPRCVHDGLLLVFAGGLTAYSALVLARGVMRTSSPCATACAAVGEGRRDVEIRTAADDEIAELAAAANRMAAQLAAAGGRARRGRRRPPDLMAAVSHDLRTPLTSLRLLTDAIEDDLVDRTRAAATSSRCRCTSLALRADRGPVRALAARGRRHPVVDAAGGTRRARGGDGRGHATAGRGEAGGRAGRRGERRRPGARQPREAPAGALQPDPERHPAHARRRQRDGGRRVERHARRGRGRRHGRRASRPATASASSSRSSAAATGRRAPGRARAWA